MFEDKTNLELRILADEILDLAEMEALYAEIESRGYDAESFCNRPLSECY